MYLNVLSTLPQLSHITINKSVATLQRWDAAYFLDFFRTVNGFLIGTFLTSPVQGFAALVLRLASTFLFLN